MNYREAARTLVNVLDSKPSIQRIVRNKRQHYYSMAYQALKAYVEAVSTGRTPHPAVKSAIIKGLTSLVRSRPLTLKELNSIDRVVRVIVDTLRRLGRIELKNLAIYLRLCNLMLRSGDRERFRILGIQPC